MKKLVLGAAVALIGGAFLIYRSASHYKMVDDLVAGDLESWQDKELQVHGWVEASSIVETIANQEIQRTFVLRVKDKRIRVFSRGPKPDTFKDLSEVVATGHLVPASQMQALATALCTSRAPVPPNCPVRADGEQPWVVDASDLMAKCPSRYARDSPDLGVLGSPPRSGSLARDHAGVSANDSGP
jgi:cytochrome c-type biogenesis protein CcmE